MKPIFMSAHFVMPRNFSRRDTSSRRSASPGYTYTMLEVAAALGVPHMQRSSPNASMTRSTGSQISSYGNGWCDIVQAPLIFTLTFSY